MTDSFQLVRRACAPLFVRVCVCTWAGDCSLAFHLVPNGCLIGAHLALGCRQPAHMRLVFRLQRPPSLPLRCRPPPTAAVRAAHRVHARPGRAPPQPACPAGPAAHRSLGLPARRVLPLCWSKCCPRPQCCLGSTHHLQCRHTHLSRSCCRTAHRSTPRRPAAPPCRRPSCAPARPHCSHQRRWFVLHTMHVRGDPRIRTQIGDAASCKARGHSLLQIAMSPPPSSNDQ